MSKLLFKNLSALSLVQIGNYAIPLLLIPYISRIVGVENYGQLEFARTLVFYFTVFIDYGFNYTATRDISINRFDKDKLNRITTEVYASKIILFLISSVFFYFLIYSDRSLSDISSLLWGTYMINIGFMLFPIWLFQGLEKIAKIAFINFFIKLIVLSSTFLLLKNKDQYWIYNSLQSISQILIGVISVLIIHRILKIRFCKIQFKDVIFRLKSSFNIFLSTILVNIFASYTFLVLKDSGSDTDVGIYATAFKLAITIQTIVIIPFSQAFFPHMALKAEKNIYDFHRYVSKTAVYLLAGMVVLCISSYILAEPIISVLFGKEYLIAVPTFKILAFLPIFSALTNLYSYQGLLNLKKDKLFLQIHIFATVIVIALTHLIVPEFGLNGASWLRVGSEILLMTASFLFYHYYIKKLSNARS